MRRRVALFVVVCASAMAACNALTGIGDYAVGTEMADATDDVAPPHEDSSSPLDAGADADADDAPDGCMIVDHPAIKAAQCTEDAGNPGPAMASLMYGFEETHCIDTTEVTVAQYNVFLGERGPTNTCGQPPGCEFNTTYAPAEADPADEDTPQVDVNWCDAFMYCQWAGKHLCGTFGYAAADGGEMPSGNVPPGSEKLQGTDEWYTFCLGTGDGVGSEYFYGDTFQLGTCQDDHLAKGEIARVASAPDCHGTNASTAVYDMVGNAAEWEWSCADSTTQAECAIRGGSYIDLDTGVLSCDPVQKAERNTSSANLGFRCCVE